MRIAGASRLLHALAVTLLAACGGSDAPGPFTSITGSGRHTCGLTASGVAYCWGDNEGGTLGVGRTGDQTRPARVVLPPESSFVSLGAGWFHTCGISEAGTVYCWGDNEVGELGDGTTTLRTAPVAVVMPQGVRFASVSLNVPHHLTQSFTCALTSAGAAYCWGGNDRGQLGDGTTTPRPVPGAVTTPEEVSFTALVTGAAHACGLTPAGTVYCWGANDEGGQLGDGTTVNRALPVPARLPPKLTFTKLAAGGHHTCGLTAAGTAYCWGFNYGRLGDGSEAARPLPTAVVMPDGVSFTAIAAGSNHTCALSSLGGVYCWGRNSHGQLGDGTSGDGRGQPAPVVLPAQQRFVALSAGWMHSCALTPAGEAYCWGRNTHGQLGDGTLLDRAAPVPVAQR